MINNSNYSFYSLLEDLENREDINSYIDDISNLIDKHIALRIGAKSIHINHIALHQALERYSKDVFGYRRVKSKIEEAIKDNDMISYIRTSCGFMLETDTPHINKQIAYLCYHLASTKPFSLDDIDDKYFDGNRYLINFFYNYFNEIIIYFIVILILQSVGKVNLKEDNVKHFLHSLRYRNLSRSSLELLFENIIVPK